MAAGERIRVPAREGRAVRVEAGRRFRIVDVEGGQVADTFTFCADDVSEYHSAEHTRVHVSRLFPRPGEDFVTNERRPVIHFERDDSPGIHDMLCAACDPARFAGLGVEGWHASCRENLERAMASLGHTKIEIPQPINLFMNTPVVDAAGTIEWLPAQTNEGDSVTMRAEVDIVLVVSACPQDILAINATRPTPIEIELLA
ncbi:MAG: urea carboxylase-associated family protein [Thermoleophilia bacterium]|nr:urea carboxylase-associated family protein [Thermoleophilia bacterium]